MRTEKRRSLLALITSKNVRQFLSYFAVGGASAVVEWVIFFLLGRLLTLPYLSATALAFVFSTTANWFLGRTFTFRGADLGKNKSKEILQVFGVSAIGLLGNLALMYVFVSVLGMNTELLKTTAKILSTGIVFIWNFLIRKFWIYRDA